MLAELTSETVKMPGQANAHTAPCLHGASNIIFRYTVVL